MRISACSWAAEGAAEAWFATYGADWCGACYMHMCVCTHTHICIHACMRTNVCVYAREREREREREYTRYVRHLCEWLYKLELLLTEILLH